MEATAGLQTQGDRMMQDITLQGPVCAVKAMTTASHTGGGAKKAKDPQGGRTRLSHNGLRNVCGFSDGLTNGENKHTDR